MTLKLIIFISILLITNNSFGQIVSGIIKDYDNGDDLIGVQISSNSKSSQSFSNKYGFFSINSSKYDTLTFHLLGYNDSTFIVINEFSKIKILLKKKPYELNEIIVSKGNSGISNGRETGKFTFNQKQIKDIPMLFGEKDPIRALHTLPGFQETKEGSSGLTVRGGSTGQNLLILDEAIVYNANHLFGFFSTFNSDAIININAYKTAFPAQYGGRVSSIIDLKLKEGNINKFQINGGIGILSSRILIEGPIIKNKVSFLISARRTYADLILKPFQSKNERTSYFFYDLNAKLKFDFGLKNQLYFSFYTGKDVFKQESNIARLNGNLLNSTGLDWRNLTYTLKWNKIFSDKLFQNFNLIYSDYGMNYVVNTKQDYLNPVRFENIKYGSSLNNFSMKIDFDYFQNNNSTLKFGTQTSYFNFIPRSFSYKSQRLEDDFNENSEKEKVLENDVYANLNRKLPYMTINSGLRYVIFYNTKIYNSLEPRFEIKSDKFSFGTFSLSFSRMNQFIHLISNTGNGLPTDTWIPSTPKLKPVNSNHFNFNFSKEFGKVLDLSLDVYYKVLNGNADFKADSQFLKLFQNSSNINAYKWDENLTQGRGWSYGYELFLQKKGGRFNGHLGYTLSWAISQNKELNNGLPFYNNFDRRHIFEFVTKYQISKKISVGTNFIYNSGNPISLAQTLLFSSDYGTNYLEYIPGINNYRTSPYHRLDIGVEVATKKLNTWEFSIYNVYNRKNPYNYELKNKFGLEERILIVKTQRQSLFPFLPSVTYNFKLK